LIEQHDRVKRAEIYSQQLKIASQRSATIAYEFNNPMAVIQGMWN